MDVRPLPRRPRAGLWLSGVLAVVTLGACAAGPGEATRATRAAADPATAGTAPAPAIASPSAGPAPGAPDPAPPSECVRQALAGLSRSERAGQVLMIGVPVLPARSLDHTEPVVRRHRLGGVFLSGRSTASVSAVRHRTDGLRAASADGPGLLVATDQEGGEVQALTGPGFTRIPAALTQGRSLPADLRAATRAWAAALARAGISMNLAPVADTVPAGRGASNPPIGRYGREYGRTSPDTADAVAAVVAGLDDEKVLPTVKHFPGLGRVRHNTDTSARAVDGQTDAADPYLRPFAAGMDAGAGAVMISSARYPQLDRESIAPFSRPIITGLLREQLGWNGVVISDDLGRARAVTGVPAGQRATRFIAAGGDLVLSVVTSDAGRMRAALIEKADGSTAFAAQLNAAVTRVLQLKERAGLLHC